MTDRLRLVAAAILVIAIGACGDPVDDFGTPAAGPSVVAGEVLVSAASSLSDAFGEISAAFEAAHPGVDVVLNLGASSALREQIMSGAPVDVYASANPSNMDQLVAAGDVAVEPRVFARNLLQIAVPAGNPAGVGGLGDFANSNLLIGLCAVGVPCGDFARQALQNAGVIAATDTNEPDVRALLTKIAAGELDAGITYVTDVASAGAAVEGIEIPRDVNVAAAYSIAALSTPPNPVAAAAFVGFVLSGEGQAILGRYGFGSP